MESNDLHRLLGKALHRESIDRRAELELVERDLKVSLQAIHQLQNAADGHASAISKAHEVFVPAAKMESARSLATVEEEKIKELATELQATKGRSGSIEGEGEGRCFHGGS